MPLSLRQTIRRCAEPLSAPVSLEWMPRALDAAKPVLFHVNANNEAVMVERYAERVRRLVMPTGVLIPKSYPQIPLFESHLRLRSHAMKRICEHAVEALDEKNPSQHPIRECALKAIQQCKPIWGEVVKCDPEKLGWFQQLVQIAIRYNADLLSRLRTRVATNKGIEPTEIAVYAFKLCRNHLRHDKDELGAVPLMQFMAVVEKTGVMALVELFEECLKGKGWILN